MGKISGKYNRNFSQNFIENINTPIIKNDK